MRRFFAILTCFSVLTLASCSSASESSVSEESVKSETTTAATTETATEKETTEVKETTTEAKLTLDKEYTFNDITISVPDSANKTGSLPVGDSTLTYINFNDSSEMLVSITDNTSGVSFSSATSEQLQDVLESFATSFSSSFNDNGTIDKVNLSNGVAIKQTLKKGNNLTIAFHIAYNERIYTIGFLDTQGNDKTTAPSIADDVINSMKFKPIEATTEKATEKPTEPSTKPQTEPITTKQNFSVGQENALKKAKRYIETTPMSFDGLVEQLEYEGFSSEESRYGAENCGADWNEQAIKKAKRYIDLSGFSYSSLVEQLEYEKFTHDQATYGADNCGADWNAEAAKAAKKYMDLMPMSREQLIEQLLYEGYTNEQAEYGASSVGY